MKTISQSTTTIISAYNWRKKNKVSMKTAMQQFIDQLHEYGWIDKNDVHFQLHSKEFIEKEKQQIIEAANAPADGAWYNGDKYKNFGEQYYSETFKQEKE